MSYCIARARPAGSSGDGSSRSPDAVVEQRLVLGHDAAERVVGRVPAAVLGVPLVHREAVDPAVREHVRVGQAEPPAELHPQPAQDVVGRRRRRRRRQDEVALGRAGRARRIAACVSADEELRDRAVELAARLDGEVDEALRAEPLRALGQLVDLACASTPPMPGAAIALTRPPRGERLVEHAEARTPARRRRRQRGREVDQLHREPQVRLVASRTAPSPRRR